MFSVEPSEFVETCGDIRMLSAERFLSNGQRSPVERLSLRILPLAVVEHCEAVEACGDRRMLSAERFLSDGYRSLVKRFSVRILCPLIQVISRLVHHPGGFGKFKTKLIDNASQ